MPKDRRRLADEWFEVAEADLQTARIALAGGAPGGSAVMLLQQGVEKYLKGYLIFQGWRLRKTHDLEALIDSASEYDASLGDFVELATALTSIYVGDRYPPLQASAVSNEEAGKLLAQTNKLIQKIKDAVGGS